MLAERWGSDLVALTLQLLGGHVRLGADIFLHNNSTGLCISTFGRRYVRFRNILIRQLTLKIFPSRINPAILDGLLTTTVLIELILNGVSVILWLSCRGFPVLTMTVQTDSSCVCPKTYVVYRLLTNTCGAMIAPNIC